MKLPAPYDELPLDLQETLIRSHIEAEKGWKGLTLAEYMKMRDEEGHLDVIRDVHGRCRVLPGLWSHVDAIVGPWTYAGGHDISMGFSFVCAKPEALLSFIKASDKFCQDGVNCHGPRDTFRELIRSGPGLHICIAQPEARGTHMHDMHIDKYQTVCQRKADGYCEYAYLDQNFIKHMKDVTPWWVGERFKDLGRFTARNSTKNPPKY